MNDSTLQFFEALFPDGAPENSSILVWTIPDKTSYWHRDTVKAAEEAERQSDAKADVYVGAGLGPARQARNRRTKNNDVTAIAALWLDIDYSDDVHKKKNLPTREEAQAFIRDEVGKELSPSIVIHTGHGFHVWWLLDELWLFEDDAERKTGAATVHGWMQRAKALAEAHGWALDSTFDLARVMRVPGTWNRKGAPVAVTTEYFDPDARYPRAAFAEWSLAPTAPHSAPGSPEAGSLSLDPLANPPFDKWMALQALDVRVVKTWNRERKDFTDQSPSSYDMSLASFAAGAMWSDQEIADLIIASRRHHRDDLKLRQDYYARTIARGRGTTETRKIEDAIHDATDLSGDEKTAALSSLFGVNIVKITKYIGDPPTYVLELRMNNENRSITLGGIETIMTQRLFRHRVAAVVNVIIPSCAPAQWERRAQALLDAMEEQELGPETTPAGAARQWLEEYLQAHRPSEDWKEAVKAGRPYLNEDFIHVTLRNVAFWLRQSQGERITSRELARYMRMSGWEQYTQWVPNNTPGAPASTRSVWRTLA